MLLNEQGHTAVVDRFIVLAKDQDSITTADLDRRCLDQCRTMGFEYFVFVAWSPRGQGMPSHYFATNFPEGYAPAYAPGTGAFFASLGHRLGEAMRPFTWRTIDRGSENVDALISRLDQVGVGDAVSFPVHGPRGSRALFTVAGGSIPPEGSEALKRLYADGLLFMARAFDVALDLIAKTERATGNRTPLSIRQCEVLTAIAEGLAIKDIAKKLDISSGTVRVHLEHCLQHLQVKTREQAILKAFACGYINPVVTRTHAVHHR